MTNSPMSKPRTPASRPLALRPDLDDRARGDTAGPFLCGLRAASLLAAGTCAVALIAGLDLATGSQFSFGLFYLLPVMACAWWAGLSSGLLLALIGTAAWHYVDAAHAPALSLGVLLCNA